jgi:predicted signal transduction protein with EAL and GGDEF domain
MQAEPALGEGGVACRDHGELRVVAEGVETLAQAEFLRSRICDEAQGFYFSRPVSAAQLAVLLETGLQTPLGGLAVAAALDLSALS